MKTHKRPSGLFLAFSLLAVALLQPSTSHAQQVLQRRGVDQRVQYDSLKRFGPWDERNYQLTAEDLQLLAPNEAELPDPIPAFYRVQLRRNNPNLPRTGTAQYPRSAVQLFMLEYGGYMVNDKLYKRARWENGRFNVVETPEAPARSFEPSRFLVGELRLTTPAGAAESAIKISPADPDRVIAGVNGAGGGQDMYFSSDGGASWTISSLPLGGTCCDPTVDWSSDGQYAYAGALGSGGGIWFYRSSDNGQTWTDLQTLTPGDPRRELSAGGSDKEYLHVDKHPGSPFRDNLYMTWHTGGQMQFARSTDQGNTWTNTSFSGDPRGIGSDITTDRNGNVYYFYPASGGQRKILLKRSTDGGASFAAGTTLVANTNGDYEFPIPSMESRKAWIYVSADADLSGGPFSGSVYAAWTDTYATDNNFSASANHTRIQVARSRDGGNTWAVATPHPTTDADEVDRWNPWMAVGRDGTVHVIYYDTRHSTGRSGVDLYYSFSTNGGQTFSTPERLTGATSPNITDFFEFGDYNGLDHVVCQIAIYTDNRSESGSGGDSRDVYTIGIDKDAPGINCPANITVNNDPGQCAASVSFAASGSDACSAVSLAYSPASGASFVVGSTVVTAAATDEAGNTTTCQFAVTVVDDEPPAIACPANRTQSCELPTTPAVTGTPVALDNCGAVSVTHSDLTTPGSCPENYTITRRWQVSDAHGLTNECLQTIVVQDLTPPLVVCPPAITVTCDISPDSTGRATVGDNCDTTPERAFSDGTPVGGCEWLCTFRRTWMGTDNCGNTSTCAQQITKNTLPLIEKALRQDINGDGRADTLILGTSNSTLTIPPGQGHCIPQWLPGAGALPSGIPFDNAVPGAGCRPGNNPVNAAGKLQNPLLAEALKLNILVRLKAGLGTKKLSDYGSCISPVVLHYLASDPDVNELLRVTNTALGNVAVQPHLAELLAALQCINGPLEVCD